MNENISIDEIIHNRIDYIRNSPLAREQSVKAMALGEATYWDCHATDMYISFVLGGYDNRAEEHFIATLEAWQAYRAKKRE